MKRIISLLLSLFLLFGITGCQLDSETIEIIGDVAEIASDIANEISSTEREEQAIPISHEKNNQSSKDSNSDNSDKATANNAEDIEEASNNKVIINPDETKDTKDEEISDEASDGNSADDLYEILPENGSYTKVEDVSLYIYLYKKLPDNFITKSEARELGWQGGGLDDYAEGKCIGGDRFGNYEGLLPSKKGRTYTECDIDTLGKSSRGAKRIVFSNDGLIFYTPDHYESFIQLYDANGEVDS